MLAATTSYWFTWFPGSLLASFGVLAIFWKMVSWLSNAVTTMKKVQVALPIIQSEFSPDHGHSMKDRMEALHDKTDAHIIKVTAWQTQHAHDDDRRFAKVEASLDRIEDQTR